LVPPSSGTTGSPITFGNYGTGANPLINGSGLISGFTAYSPGGPKIYQASVTAYTGIPQKVWFNNTLGTAVGSIAALTGANDWYWASNVLYVYSTSNPATAYTSPGIEASIWDGVYITQSYITINGIDTTKSANGVHVNATAALSSINVYNGTHAYEGGNGIWYTTYSGHNISGGIIQGNTTHDNGGMGIGLTNSDSITVSNNTSYSNGAVIYGCSGLYEIEYTYAAPPGDTIGGNIFEYNLVYSSLSPTGNPNDGGSGLHLDQVYGNEVVRGNVFYDNVAMGILVEANHAPSDAVGPLMEYNIVYGNGEAGIYISSRSDLSDDSSSTTGATFAASRILNNTVYGNVGGGIYLGGEGVGETMSNNVVENNISEGNTNYQLVAYGGAQNDGTYGSGNVYLYNSFGTAASNFIEWGWGVYKSTYADFDTAYGSATHSITTAPTFTNAGSGDFTLASGSSAIKAGTNLGSSYQMGLKTGSSWPSSVSTLNQNSQGSGWEIGAFVFVQHTAPAPPTSLSATVN
jgi:parallel beta-helix repeat protein